MKSKTLLAIGMCVLMLATIPMAAGATNKPTNDPKTTDLFGTITLRGFVFAWKEYGNQVHARALRVHYTTHGPGASSHGVVYMKELIFQDRFAVDQMFSGPFLGLVRWIFGIYHGTLRIRG